MPSKKAKPQATKAKKAAKAVSNGNSGKKKPPLVPESIKVVRLSPDEKKEIDQTNGVIAECNRALGKLMVEYEVSRSLIMQDIARYKTLFMQQGRAIAVDNGVDPDDDSWTLHAEAGEFVR